MIRRAALVLAVLAALLAPAAPAAADWELVPLPPPPGGEFSVPVGYPGDLSFWAPNRGLLSVEGNAAVPEGLYSWDGQSWHQLATVCGGAERARIAWAGPTEFWTITRPSLPRDQSAVGTALCRFKDGEVVGSYSTPPDVEDPYHEMTAAACTAPDNCWFGGFGAQDGTGTRIGAFHIRWDGAAVTTAYNAQGRAVSDLVAHQGELLESSHVGQRPDNEGFDGAPEPPFLAEPEAEPLLLGRIAGGSFARDPFVPEEPSPGYPPEATELRALSTNGTVAWAVGGGANSGPFAPVTDRAPLALRRAGAAWEEVELKGDPVDPGTVFGDVAAIPGSEAAWVTVNEVNEGRGDVAANDTQVARIAADGTVTREVVAASGRGRAKHVACPAPDDCWLVTSLGYLYRNSTAAQYARDEDPAFQGTITQRPNEAAAQFIPDSPPEDISGLIPPPVEAQPEPADADLPPCRPQRSVVAKVKAKASGTRRLVVSFRLRKPARIGLVARHKGKVVARSAPRRLRKGAHAITLRVTPQRWPTSLKFRVSGVKKPKPRPCSGGGGDDGDVITSGPATTALAR